MDSSYYLAGLTAAPRHTGSCQTFLHPRKSCVARAPALWCLVTSWWRFDFNLHLYTHLKWFIYGLNDKDRHRKWKLHQDGRLSTFANGCEPRWVNCFTHSKDLSQHPISWAWRLKEPSLPRLTDPRTTDAEGTGSSLRFLLVLAASQQCVWTKTITRWSLVHRVVIFTPKWASVLQVLKVCAFLAADDGWPLFDSEELWKFALGA